MWPSGLCWALVCTWVLAGGAVECPELARFGLWMEQYARSCTPPVGGSAGTSAAGSDCEWITCPCLEVALQVPVQLDLVGICLQEGVLASNFTQEERRTASELVRGSACGDRTRELASPCGQCDRFRMERPDCYDTTAVPYRTFEAAPSGASRGCFVETVLALVAAMLFF
mmetsp:Transcript_12803/g.22663  ORF Transcript_12803/g.22663 Transcript_12803/m.22663 type:complete len:170 (-) Transcript_12803:35-544(-)